MSDNEHNLKFAVEKSLIIKFKVMCQGYVLEWLDRLITISLNPLKTDLTAILEVERSKIKIRMEEENLKLRTFLKDLVFSLGDDSKIRSMIKNYHSGLILLLNQALENRMKCPKKSTELKLLTDDVITSVEEMLSFIEKRFSGYLNPDDPVPATYSDEVINEMNGKLDTSKRRLTKNKYDKQMMEIVFLSLHAYLEKMLREHSMVFRDVFYLKTLCSELDNLDHTGKTDGIYTSLDKLLIGMNFNDKAYADYIIGRLIKETYNCKDIQNRLEVLLLNFKALKQIPLKPDIAFNLHAGMLNEILNNWLVQEIAYLKEKQRLFTAPDHKAVMDQLVKKKLKVLCVLSTDQMGIILRAADELKILTARSLNEVFRIIVPHLSTPHKENLSYDAMRSKSYSAEMKDKEIAIGTLKQLIEKIEEY